MKVVIIGGVAGGATAAARLRRLNEQAEIVVIERTGYVSYANCGLPYYIGETIQDEGKLTLQTPESFRARFDIDVRVRQEAVRIDRAAKTVAIRRLDDGGLYEESYDYLILSPGAKAVVPSLPGIDDARIDTLRTVEDTFAIKKRADELVEAGKTNAVVIGGGFIGLEMAENLAHRGFSVTLLQRGNHVMPTLDYDMACEVHAYLRSRGIDLRLGFDVVGFAPDDERDEVRVLGGNGESIPASLAILAIGVAPETHLAEEAGLELGIRKSIVVDAQMRTSDPSIFAVGDAVQVKHFVSDDDALISLAGPANKQGRVAADAICGRNRSFAAPQGSSVLKVFDMTIAATGLSETAAQRAGLACDKAFTSSPSHATYYPGARGMSVKTLFDPESGRILGAQIVGFEGVDKRIDVFATAIRAHMTAADLEDLDLAYAPPYSSAKDPVNMAGFVIENLRCGLVKQHHWHDVDALTAQGAQLLDVRTAKEYAEGHIDGSVNIPLDDLRERLGELDAGRPVFVNCHSGLRSYVACRMLAGRGFDCSNLAGGWRLYATVAKDAAFDARPTHPCGAPVA
ncbi:MAG: FAD-dependent oxidoreductase [Slackia sp.]|nr:FAD-dependent oxidoreductase [Slackia sp.]